MEWFLGLLGFGWCRWGHGRTKFERGICRKCRREVDKWIETL